MRKKGNVDVVIMPMWLITCDPQKQNNVKKKLTKYQAYFVQDIRRLPHVTITPLRWYLQIYSVKLPLFIYIYMPMSVEHLIKSKSLYAECSHGLTDVGSRIIISYSIINIHVSFTNSNNVAHKIAYEHKISVNRKCQLSFSVHIYSECI